MLEDSGKVIIVYRDETRYLLVTDKSPFHPLDYFWKDQPGDRGLIKTEDVTLKISDTVTWPIQKQSQTLSYSPNLNIKRSDPNYILLTAHVIETITKGGDIFPLEEIFSLGLIGKNVRMEVDKEYRDSLSRPHSASHLMSLALNKVLDPLWRKDYSRDSLGNRNFDSAAISRSTISPNVSTDTYRLGDSLRKKGFSSDVLLANIEEYSKKIEETIAEWCKLKDVEVIMNGKGDFLGSYWTWNTIVDGKNVSIPCGGTHVGRIGEIVPISIEMKYNAETKEMTIVTSIKH
ncbi:MAG: hypothetical protein AB1393_06240 [Candidatus Edwardsbacteria bacterium]